METEKILAMLDRERLYYGVEPDPERGAVENEFWSAHFADVLEADFERALTKHRTCRQRGSAFPLIADVERHIRMHGLTDEARDDWKVNNTPFVPKEAF